MYIGSQVLGRGVALGFVAEAAGAERRGGPAWRTEGGGTGGLEVPDGTIGGAPGPTSFSEVVVAVVAAVSAAVVLLVDVARGPSSPASLRSATAPN
ncbi:MAG TPA: hypothetical protein VM430_08750, partial [Microbacterium sp.]|nr:hypothetical protein [Microbacterium sp.]